jgi:stress-induced-phosphoprotein 1
MAELCKDRGNNAFKDGRYEEAIDQFTQAINMDPTNHIYYSNRSAAYASMKMWDEALDDAKKCIDIQPTWAKGWSRKGAALHGRGNFDMAIVSYNQGLKIEPNNEALKAGLKAAQDAEENSGADPFGHYFGPDCWAKLTTNRATQRFMQDEDFVAKIREIQSNPAALDKHLADPRVMTAFQTLSGLNLNNLR